LNKSTQEMAQTSTPNHLNSLQTEMLDRERRQKKSNHLQSTRTARCNTGGKKKTGQGVCYGALEQCIQDPITDDILRIYCIERFDKQSPGTGRCY
jgi:hypothetical protein